MNAENRSHKKRRGLKIVLPVAVVCLVLLGCVLARPAPPDLEAEAWPVYQPIVNGELVTLEVIRVNGQSVPTKVLEKATERLGRYVAGEVRLVDGDAIELELGKEGGVTLGQLESVLDGSKYGGPSGIALILVPSLEGIPARGGCQSHTLRKDGETRGSVVICCQVIRNEALGIPWIRNLVMERVISHELLHTLGVPADRSHAAGGRHCTNPECLLYFRIDHRSVAAAILHLGPPRGLCKTCEGEIRAAQLAAKGELFGPDCPYDPLEYENEKVRMNPDHPDSYAGRARVYMTDRQKVGPWQRQ